MLARYVYSNSARVKAEVEVVWVRYIQAVHVENVLGIELGCKEVQRLILESSHLPGMQGV